VMTHETLQTSYSAKEIAPRIVIGFVTANLSMVLMSKAIDLANGLSAAFTAGGVSPQSAATSLMNTLSNAIANNGIFLILLALAGVILALVLAAVYVIRLMAVVLLAAAAPVLLALYALPQTAWAARWWWRALTAALAIQVAQGLVMTAAVQVFLSPGWLPGGISSTLGQTLITLCLLYILMRIPSWIARPVLSPFGGSPLRRAARFVVTAAVLSRIAPALAGRRSPPPARRPGGASSPGRGPSPGPVRPPRPPGGPAGPGRVAPVPPPARRRCPPAERSAPAGTRPRPRCPPAEPGVRAGTRRRPRCPVTARTARPRPPHRGCRSRGPGTRPRLRCPRAARGTRPRRPCPPAAPRTCRPRRCPRRLSLRQPGPPGGHPGAPDLTARLLAIRRETSRAR
jgi:hypothetical protein